MALVPMNVRRANGTASWWPVGIGDPSIGGSRVGDTISLSKISGAYRLLGGLMVSNTHTTSSTYEFTLNDVAGNQIITIPATGAFVAGYYQTDTAVDVPADGDTIQLKFIPGTGGALSMTTFGTAFQATQDTSQFVGSFNALITGASVVNYSRLNGNGGSTTDNATRGFIFKVAGTAKFLSNGPAGNTRVTNGGVFQSMLNNASAGNQANTFNVGDFNTKVVAAGVEDVMAVNDALSLTATTGAGGSGAIGALYLFGYTNTANKAINAVTIGALAGTAYAASGTKYEGLNGRLVLDSANTNPATRVGVVATVDSAAVYAVSNTVTAASTMTFQADGTDTGLTITVDGSGTFVAGLYTGNGTNVPLVPTQTGNWKVTTGAGGTSLFLAYLSDTMSLLADPSASNRLSILGVG